MEVEKTVLTGEFSPKFHECRPGGEIHLHALVRYLQGVATHHADLLGCGFHDLAGLNRYWVLSNIAMAFNDLPGYNEPFTLKTWPSGLNRLLAEREFVAYDSAGKELVRASSEWVIMEAGNNRPVNLLAMDLHLPQKHEKVFQTPLKRLKPLFPRHSGGEHRNPVLRITVPFSALDVNGHVNNAQYVKWMMDAIVHLTAKRSPVTNLQITYLSEAFEKDEIEIFLSPDRQNLRTGITGINLSTGKAAFAARMACKTP